MTTNSYVEYFLTLFGWIMSNAITAILIETCLVLVPIVTIIISSWLKARDQGHDEGNKGLLSLTWVETRIYVMLAVLMFTFMPIYPINFNVLEYDDTRSKQCGRVVVVPSETAWGMSFSSLSGRTAKMPIWWAFVHTVSKGVTAAAISSLPCSADLRQVQVKVDNARLFDPILRNEVGDFVRDCYAGAKVTLFARRTKLTKEQINEVGWIGSKYFLETPGYYDTENARSPRREWPYDPERDQGYSVTDRGGYPKCNEWWTDSELGLRAKLTEQVEPTTWELLRGAFSFRPTREVEDAMLKVLVSPQNQRLTNGSVYRSYNSLNPNAGDFAANVGAVVGAGAGGLAYFPFLSTVRQSLPNILAYTIMIVIICLPLILTIGAFDLKVAVTLTFVLFSLYFLDFWFELARWIDTRLLDALYGTGSPHSSLNLSGLSNATGDLFISFVTGTMFLLIPALWIGALGWAGVKMGGVAETVAGVSTASKPTESGAQIMSGRLTKEHEDPKKKGESKG